jgi:hypothetical protein
VGTGFPSDPVQNDQAGSGKVGTGFPSDPVQRKSRRPNMKKLFLIPWLMVTPALAHPGNHPHPHAATSWDMILLLGFGAAATTAFLILKAARK